MLKSLILCALHTNNEKEAYTWALVKADFRVDSRLKTGVCVKKKIERAALTIKDIPGYGSTACRRERTPFTQFSRFKHPQVESAQDQDMILPHQR